MKLDEFLRRYGDDDETAANLLKLKGKPVAYYPKMAHVFGGVTHAVFLCQMLYWHGKESLVDNWIYKTMAEITDETGLSKREQQTARKYFRAARLLEEKKVGIPAKNYYRFNWKEIAIALLQSEQNAPTARGETRPLVETQRADKRAQDAPTGGSKTGSLYTEITHETTHETTHSQDASVSGTLWQEEAFKKVLEHYPKKQQLHEAFKEWKKLNIDEATLAHILNAIDHWSKTKVWNNENGRYIPNLAAWLRGRRWLDEPPPKLHIYMTEEEKDAALIARLLKSRQRRAARNEKEIKT